MSVGCRIRITLAAAIAVAGAGSIAMASSVEAGPAPLRPDLRTLRPLESQWLDLDVKKNSATLYLSNRIANQGDGPLELRTGQESEECNGQSQFPGDQYQAIQRIYEDDGGGQPDPESYAETPVGCFEFHPAHSHWHLQDFSQYLLRGSDDEIVGDPSNKIGFCIVDGDRAFSELPGSPASGVYPNDDGCGFDEADPPGTMGLSVGWADTYGLGLPGQELNVSGVKKGKYCLVSTANPDHKPDADPSQLKESDPDNNARKKLVKLNPKKERVKTIGACPPPAELSKLGPAAR
jgi:hypothetical protein